MATASDTRRPAAPATARAAVRVIGIGRFGHGDDAIGRLVARRLAEAPPAGVWVGDCAGEFGSLLELWDGADAVIVVDALKGGSRPGTLLRFDANDVQIPAAPRTSVHGFGLPEAIEAGRMLQRLPPALVVLGVEAQVFTPGVPLSPPVAAAFDALVAAVRREAVRLSAQFA